ncbi:hypothetical protein CHUAL_008840 [Chamberlinius hualienensis]
MKLATAPLMLLLCWIVTKANVIPEEKLDTDVMPSVYPKIQAEAYSYVTSGAYINNDCGSTTVGYLRNGGMLRFDNVDVGPVKANFTRIRFSNEALGSMTTVKFYIDNPVVQLNETGSVNATRTNDWCDFVELTIDVTDASPEIKGKFNSLYFKFVTDVPNSEGIDFDWFSFE